MAQICYTLYIEKLLQRDIIWISGLFFMVFNAKHDLTALRVWK